MSLAEVVKEGSRTTRVGNWGHGHEIIHPLIRLAEALTAQFQPRSGFSVSSGCGLSLRNGFKQSSFRPSWVGRMDSIPGSKMALESSVDIASVQLELEHGYPDLARAGPGTTARADTLQLEV
jgi:hypothetical protein